MVTTITGWTRAEATAAFHRMAAIAELTDRRGASELAIERQFWACDAWDSAAAEVAASNELLADSNPTALSVVGDSIVRDLSQKMDKAFFGNVTANGPSGLDSLLGRSTRRRRQHVHQLGRVRLGAVQARASRLQPHAILCRTSEHAAPIVRH